MSNTTPTPAPASKHEHQPPQQPAQQHPTQRQTHRYERGLYGMLAVWHASRDPVLRIAVWRYCWGVATGTARKGPRRREVYVNAVACIACTPLLQSYTTLDGLERMYALGAEGYPDGIFSGVDLDALCDPQDGRGALTWAVIEGAAYWWRAHELAFGVPPDVPLATALGETLPISAAADAARAAAARVVEVLAR